MTLEISPTAPRSGEPADKTFIASKNPAAALHAQVRRSYAGQHEPRFTVSQVEKWLLDVSDEECSEGHCRMLYASAKLRSATHGLAAHAAKGGGE